MIVVELIVIFVAGVWFGGISVMDDMQYKLDKCDTVRQDSLIEVNELKGDLKLCELRQEGNVCPKN